MTTTRELWENALTDLELSLPKAALLLGSRHPYRPCDEGVVYVGVPSQFVRDWFVSKYHKLIWLLCDVFLKACAPFEYVYQTSKENR